jgi:hypothetical protein
LCFVHLAVDPGNLHHPSPPLLVLQVHHLFMGPVEVIRDEGYLLIQPGERVA